MATVNINEEDQEVYIVLSPNDLREMGYPGGWYSMKRCGKKVVYKRRRGTSWVDFYDPPNDLLNLFEEKSKEAAKILVDII